jgi:hypothetical protein
MEIREPFFEIMDLKVHNQSQILKITKIQSLGFEEMGKIIHDSNVKFGAESNAKNRKTLALSILAQIQCKCTSLICRSVT